jgi:UDP-N-acetylglucosamine 2-epimerase (non-hydrolysing)
LGAFYRGIKVIHLEAGLRTGDIHNPFPEEANRVFISKIADFHLAPTEATESNLIREGVNPKNILRSGNTVTDAVLLASKNVASREDISDRFNTVDFTKKVILVTAHRRENLGDGIESIANAVKKVAQSRNDVEIVFPVHLNPLVRKVVFSKLQDIKNVHLLDPLEYADMVWIMNRSCLVLTDSGGIQEEAPTLGKPVLVMRNSTERPEGIEAGTAKLVGTNENTIFDTVIDLLDNKGDIYIRMSRANSPYGDGNCSAKIIRFVSELS